MLLRALVDFTDTYLADELEAMAFEEKPVHWEVIIGPDGSYHGVRSRTPDGERMPMSLTIARSPVSRTAGVNPLLACDAIQYVVGPDTERWTDPSKENTHEGYHAAFAELIEEAANATDAEALKAAAAFYEHPEAVSQANKDLHEAGATAGNNVALHYQPEDGSPGIAVISSPEARRYWRRHYDEKLAERHESAGKGFCLISGKYQQLARTHERIKGAAGIGGQAAGVSLMSFDKPAFKSYNWDQNVNSPIGITAANAYVLALNSLMRTDKHLRSTDTDILLATRRTYGDVAFLYWCKNPADDDIVEILNEADPEEVSRLFASLNSGNPEAVDVLDSNAFYLLAVSGNGGRLVVRDFLSDSLTRVRSNLAQWFRDLRVADVFHGGDTAAPPKLWQLFDLIASPGEKKNRNYRAIITTSLVSRALFNRKLGRSILSKALGRIRARKEKVLNPQRIGLIRLCVNDLIVDTEKKYMKEKLDTANDHPAYICGRLLAMYEQLQYEAGRSRNSDSGGSAVGVTVVDRFFNMASTYPQLAFTNIDRLARAHYKKVRRDNPGAYVSIKREIEALMAKLDGTFPRQLSLEDQGRFVIGFYHQNAERSQRIAEAKARKAEKDSE